MAKATTLPRGIRNNNPGNIRIGDKWQGLVMSMERKDADFCEFKDPTWGIRALAATLITYQDRYKINTIDGIIKRWAPPIENNTQEYINAVSRLTRFGAHDTLDLHRYEAMQPILEAIIRHENGRGPLGTINTWYDRQTIDAGLQRAGIVNQATVIAKVPVTKETVGASATGAVGVAQLADVAPQVMAVVDNQQSHLSSGSIVRIVLGVLTIAFAVYIAYSQVKKHQVGVVA